MSNNLVTFRDLEKVDGFEKSLRNWKNFVHLKNVNEF